MRKKMTTEQLQQYLEAKSRESNDWQIVIPYCYGYLLEMVTAHVGKVKTIQACLTEHKAEQRAKSKAAKSAAKEIKADGN